MNNILGIRDAIILYNNTEKHNKNLNINIYELYNKCNNIFVNSYDNINNKDKISFLTSIISNQIFDIAMIISIAFIDKLYKNIHCDNDNNKFVNDIKDIILNSNYFNPSKLINLISINLYDINSHIVGNLPDMLNSIFEYSIQKMKLYTSELYMEYKTCLANIIPIIESLSISYLYSILRFMNHSFGL